MNKKFIITDIDLDGAMSYLLLKWYHQEPIPYKQVSITNFASWFNPWYERYAKDYDEIIILDLDVGSECMNLVDKKKVTIYDHHKTHDEVKGNYKNANVNIKIEESNAKHLYRILAKTGQFKLQPKQELLVAMVNDYDCYALKLPHTHELNMIYWNYQGDRILNFESDFGFGFKGFTQDHKRFIGYRNNKVKETIGGLNIFRADLELMKSKRVLISTFCNEYINDVADFLLKTFNADAAFVVNPKTQKVSIRRSANSDLNILKIVSKIFDEAGGHEYACGGIICDKFIEFTKLFKQIQ